MFNHAPPGYQCPFCALLGGAETAANTRRDIVRQTSLATALISPRWWPNNRGHVVVVANQHHENLYDLPAECGHAVHDLIREIAIAMRESTGATRQHNEPEGDQDVWHYHVHVFPRYRGDALYETKPYRAFATGAERRPYADRLRACFDCGR